MMQRLLPCTIFVSSLLAGCAPAVPATDDGQGTSTTDGGTSQTTEDTECSEYVGQFSEEAHLSLLEGMLDINGDIPAQHCQAACGLIGVQETVVACRIVDEAQPADSDTDTDGAAAADTDTETDAPPWPPATDTETTLDPLTDSGWIDTEGWSDTDESWSSGKGSWSDTDASAGDPGTGTGWSGTSGWTSGSGGWTSGGWSGSTSGWSTSGWSGTDGFTSGQSTTNSTNTGGQPGTGGATSGADDEHVVIECDFAVTCGTD